MKLARRTLPPNHFVHTCKITSAIDGLPFYIKEVGYLNDRKFSRGNKNDYSDYLFFYSFSNMSYTKYGKKYHLNLDDLVVTACNTPISLQQQQKKKDFLYIIIGGNSAQLFYNHIRNTKNIFHINPMSSVLDHLLDIFDIDFEENPLLAQMDAGSLIHQLLVELYKLSLQVIEAKNATPVQDSSVNDAIKYIQKHYQEPLNIDAICESVSFSKFYFCKLFKEHTGMTIHQYLVNYRINRSKELLSYSKLSIAGVATSVGFNNSLTFSRQFKELTRMTPTEYREYY